MVGPTGVFGFVDPTIHMRFALKKDGRPSWLWLAYRWMADPTVPLALYLGRVGSLLGFSWQTVGWQIQWSRYAPLSERPSNLLGFDRLLDLRF